MLEPRLPCALCPHVWHSVLCPVPRTDLSCSLLGLRQTDWLQPQGAPAAPADLHGESPSRGVSWQVPIHLLGFGFLSLCPLSSLCPFSRSPAQRKMALVVSTTLQIPGNTKPAWRVQRHLLPSTVFFPSLAWKMLHCAPQWEKQHYKCIETSCHSPKISFYEQRKFHYSRMTTTALLRNLCKSWLSASALL